MITHLLFDHDGVLVDTENWYFEATREALARLDVTMTFDHYKQHLVDGASSWVSAEKKGATRAEIDAARAWRDDRYQYYLQHEDIDIPGVAEVLGELNQCFPMAVVTTSRRRDFELIHRERSLLDDMAFVLCREDYERAKPHPEPYEAGLRRFGIGPDRAIVIEDSIRGLAAAEAAGIRTIKVKNEFVIHQQAAADYTIHSLKQLPDLLSRINKELGSESGSESNLHL
ncbi:MAG: HAD family phosphatase [Proteobacteria bacterium]|nr:HAD family phosphatase [Pseudomonadota bacterium]MDA1300617.1 HAD family phosphatase [Pseudomonadota bacterium]